VVKYIFAEHLFVKNRSLKNYYPETLVGRLFQLNEENKFENYLVEDETWLSLRPALQKSTSSRSSLHKSLLPAV